MDPARRRRLELFATARGLRSLATPAHVAFRCGELYRDLPLRGQRVLEVGAGWGVYAAWAALAGATRVVALEPELDGATEGFAAGIRELAESLELDALEVVQATFQAWSAPPGSFDLVVMNAVINHLDEPACVALPHDARARAAYHQIFVKARALLRPGGHLVLTDAARRNLFGDLGLRAPLARSIEWDKHQQPELWASLARPAGFDRVSLSWYVHYPLRRLRFVVDRAWVAYALNSTFRLVLRAQP